MDHEIIEIEQKVAELRSLIQSAEERLAVLKRQSGTIAREL